jgi:hypothetical protein
MLWQCSAQGLRSSESPSVARSCDCGLSPLLSNRERLFKRSARGAAPRDAWLSSAEALPRACRFLVGFVCVQYSLPSWILGGYSSTCCAYDYATRRCGRPHFVGRRHLRLRRPRLHRRSMVSTTCGGDGSRFVRGFSGPSLSFPITRSTVLVSLVSSPTSGLRGRPHRSLRPLCQSRLPRLLRLRHYRRLLRRSRKRLLTHRLLKRVETIRRRRRGSSGSG